MGYYLIVDPSGSRVISHMAWADEGSLLVYDFEHKHRERVDIGPEMPYTTLSAGRRSFFLTRQKDGRAEATARPYEAPGHVVSMLQVSDAGVLVDGDRSVWQEYAPFELLHGSAAKGPNERLARWDSNLHLIDVQPMDWFNRGDFDFGYQGLGPAWKIPGTRFAFFTIQRDQEPAIYDPENRCVVERLKLGGGDGNPDMAALRTRPEIWVEDGDSVFAFDVPALKIRRSLHLGNMTGDISFDRSEHIGIVPRTTAGEVVGIDVSSFRLTHRAMLGRQPLVAAVSHDLDVMARDWRSGDVLTGKMAPIE